MMIKNNVRHIIGASVGAVVYVLVLGFLNNEIHTGIDLLKSIIAALIAGAFGGFIFERLIKNAHSLNASNKRRRIFATAFAFGAGVACFFLLKYLFDGNSYATNRILKTIAIGSTSGFIGGLAGGLLTESTYFTKLLGKKESA